MRPKIEYIPLDYYLRDYGGDLRKLNLEKTKTTYHDNNRGEKINSIEFGKDNGEGTQLYLVTYQNGQSKNYDPMWIETEVEFVLHGRFLKVNYAQ